MKKIAIYGAGGFGREVKMLIDQINDKNQKYVFIGYFDDGLIKGTRIDNFEVIGGINELNSYSENIQIVLTLADPIIKQKLLNSISNINVSYPILIHPNCLIGTDNVFIGDGSIICGGCILTVDIQIGCHVILNLACTVGHDTKIGSFSSIMPGVNISGEVVIGNSVYCGTGAKIINKLAIGENTIVGAGALVAKSLPSNCTVVGVPAKIVKYNN